MMPGLNQQQPQHKKKIKLFMEPLCVDAKG